MRSDDSFPFWRVVLAVALGILLAAAVQWGVSLLAASYAAEQAAEATRQAERALEAERVAEEQTRAAQEAERRRKQDEAAARRDPRPKLRQGSESMPVGTEACMYGYLSIKVAPERWQQQLRGGKAQPCRTDG